MSFLPALAACTFSVPLFGETAYLTGRYILRYLNYQFPEFPF